ncbi:MAG: SWIM zinc finger family protein [candidate division WOR-3 bacterium]
MLSQLEEIFDIKTIKKAEKIIDNIPVEVYIEKDTVHLTYKGTEGVYSIIVSTDFPPSCTCPAFVSGKICKHIPYALYWASKWVSPETFNKMKEQARKL